MLLEAGSALDTKAIIVFDGVCVLCNGWVQFLLNHDRHDRYRFAAMQGDVGRSLLARYGLDPDDPTSFLLLDAGRAFTDTDAIIRVLSGLGRGWRIARGLSLVPRGLRDPAYRWLARNRYRVFGRHAACAVPDARVRAKFL